MANSITPPPSWFAGDPPASLGPERRSSAVSLDDCVRCVGEFAREKKLDPVRGRCLTALLWLWNDHLGEAHAEVQNLGDADAAFVHGIMHRREPDPGNARYWFHRVGAHPVFEGLPDAVAECLRSQPELRRRLVRGGRWDPMAFIDLVSAADTVVDDGRAGVLRELQRLEFRVLAGHLVGGG